MPLGVLLVAKVHRSPSYSQSLPATEQVPYSATYKHTVAYCAIEGKGCHAIAHCNTAEVTTSCS